MAVGVESVSAPTQDDIILGMGKVYVNYTNAGGVEYGSVNGGSFTVDREVHNIEVAGQLGKIKGLNRKTMVVPKLKFDALAINYTNFPYGMGTTVTDEGAYHKIIEDVEIADADYLTDITFVGNTQSGKGVMIIVYNALLISNTQLDFAAKKEIINGVEYEGCYLSNALTTIPYEIRTNDA
jgi:hypothetical protein